MDSSETINNGTSLRADGHGPGSFHGAIWLAGALLALSAHLLYAPTGDHAFVNFDDPAYVAKNDAVQKGLHEGSLTYAFTETGMSDWYPVLYLSFMLDVSLFGQDNPGAHHRVNSALHVINVLLLFLLLSRWTSAPWRSAMVAGLFALHPLHVESVAWISARKDVLSTLFWLLAMHAYGSYAQRRDQNRRGWPWYLAVTLLFIGGCLTKAMLVTLPVALLIADYWPLRRHERPGAKGRSLGRHLGKIGLEKSPWILISLFIGLLHLRITDQSVEGIADPSLLERGAVAIVSYAGYLFRLVWPVDLAVWYPHPAESDPGFLSAPAFIGRLLLSLVVLGGITFLAWRLRRRRPYLITGWAWYLVTLAPVSGIVSFAPFYLCDRYAYVPMWGIYWMIVWTAADLLGRTRPRALASAASGLAVLTACYALSVRQIRVWADSGTLLRHCLASTEGNHFAHNNLGSWLLDQGRPAEALGHFEASLAIKSRFEDARNNMAAALMALGRPREAESVLRTTLDRFGPNDRTFYHLGNALIAQGRNGDAADWYRQALDENPDHADAHHNLGIALHQQGEIDRAMAHYREALRLDARHPEAYYNLANAHIALQRHNEAIESLKKAVSINPNHANAYNNLGQLLQMRGESEAALDCYRKALWLNPDHPQARAQMEFLLRNAPEQ